MDAAEREARYAYECGQRKAIGELMRGVCAAVDRMGIAINDADRAWCRRLMKRWDDLDEELQDDEKA